MIVQCATFSKSLNPRNVEKSVSDILIRIWCQAKFLTCEVSDFTPCTHAQSNILHIRYWSDTDHLWCANLHALAATNNRDHTQCSLCQCVFATHIHGCFSSCTSCSWWIAHST